MPEQLFVGRQVQLHALQDALASALRGESIVCMVAGEPGGGKTSLLKSFAHMAQVDNPDLLVAYGACDSFTGTGDPYLPFREILKLLTGDVDQGVAEGRADPENASRLRSFVRMSARALVENGPDLIDIFVPGGALMARLGGKAAHKLPWADRLAKKVADEPQTGRSLHQDRVFEQYNQVLETMSSQRPIMLLIDDLQWADRTSLGLLFHLARRLVNDAVFIVGAYRSDALVRAGEQASPLKSILGELQRIYGDITIDLGESGSRTFSNAMIDACKNRLDSEFRESIARHTAGNPLFIVELLRQLEAVGTLKKDADGYLTQTVPVVWDELPSRVVGVIETRMSYLTDEQREILKIASVHGNEFYAETISRIMEEKKRTIVKQLSGPLQKDHALVNVIGLRQIGSNTLSTYRFHHSLFQHYLYHELDEVERSGLHGDIAYALEEYAEGDLQKLALALARHFKEAQRWDKAISYCVAGAGRASEAGAPKDAISHYELALELWRTHGAVAPDFDEATVTEKLSDQLVLAGQQDAAAARYAEALRLTSGDTLERTRLLRKSSVPQQRQSRFDEAVAMLEQAEAQLGEASGEKSPAWWREWIAIQFEYCWVHYWRNEADRLEKRRDALLPIVEKWGTAEERASLYTAQIHLGLRKSRYFADEELVAFARSESGVRGSLAAKNLEDAFILGFVLLWAREFEEAIAELTETFETARRCGDIVMKTRAVIYLTVAERCLHRDDSVRARIPLARELAEYVGSVEYTAALIAQEAWLAWRSGDLRSAAEQVDEAMRTWHEKAPNYPFQWLGLWVKLALARSEGKCAEAPQLVEALLAPTQMRYPEVIQRRLSRLLEEPDETDDGERVARIDSAIELAREYGLL